MSDTSPPSWEEVAKLLAKLGDDSHAVFVIVSMGHVEDALGDRIATQMPNLTEPLRKQLFDKGALQTINTRIEIAYAMGLITETMRSDLHVLRLLRNDFSHSRSHLRRDHPKLKERVAQFSDFDPRREIQIYTMDKIDRILAELREPPQAMHSRS